MKSGFIVTDLLTLITPLRDVIVFKKTNFISLFIPFFNPKNASMVKILCMFQEFCVDVSTYQPVVWVERDGQVCKTDWIKQCEDKTENVCIDVTETVCEVSDQLSIL